MEIEINIILIWLKVDKATNFFISISSSEFILAILNVIMATVKIMLFIPDATIIDLNRIIK